MVRLIKSIIAILVGLHWVHAQQMVKQSVPKTETIKLHTLPKSVISNGCGFFLSFGTKDSGKTIDYIFASNVDQTGMVIKINNKIINIKGDGSQPGHYEASRIGEKITRFWHDKDIKIRLSCTIIGETYESASVAGTLQITFHNHTRIFQIHGWNGC